MTTVTATTAVPVCNFSRGAIPVELSSSMAFGLPHRRLRATTVKCSAAREGAAATVGKGASTAILAAAAVMASPAAALVDERMSTEGTGLSLGLSNNLLGWILLGVFALIWTLYITYTSGLEEEDEDSGLSL